MRMIIGVSASGLAAHVSGCDGGLAAHVGGYHGGLAAHAEGCAGGLAYCGFVQDKF